MEMILRELITGWRWEGAVSEVCLALRKLEVKNQLTQQDLENLLSSDRLLVQALAEPSAAHLLSIFPQVCSQ